MKRFIHLAIFNSLFSKESDLLEGENLSEFIVELKSDRGKKIQLENNITDNEMSTFIDSLNDYSTIIFHSWVNQSAAVRSLLNEGEVQHFTDDHGSLKHSLSVSFKQFVSPYIADRLLRLEFPNNEARAKAFSYLQLLDKDHRIAVEGQLYKLIRVDLEGLNELVKSATSEQELVDVVKPICSSENIEAVNHLSKASYADKLYFVDTVLAVIRCQYCSSRLANWLIKQLELLTLNKEHELKINSLKKELKTGEIKLESLKGNSFQFNWKGLLSGLLILTVIVTAIFIISMEKDDGELDEVPKHASSFKEFSKAERIEIDSLLRDLRSKRLAHDFQPDSLNAYQYSSDQYMAMRRSFMNSEMEDLYLDYYKDGLIQEGMPGKNCPDSTHRDFQTQPGTKHLKTKAGSQQSFFKNESSYDLILIVGENKNPGKMYVSYLAVGGEIEFKLNKGDVLFAVAGTGLVEYVAPAGIDQFQLPSYDFKQHFCITDYNYLESINSSFEVISSRKTIKLLASGSYNDYFQIVDIKGALSKY